MPCYNLPRNLTKHVAVIGCGTTGRQVAAVWAFHNRNVKLFDQNEKVANSALAWVKSQFSSTNNQLGRLDVVKDLRNAVQNAWMVVECIPEDIHQKSKLMEELDSLCSQNTFIASNSSAIKSSALVKNISPTGQSRILNTHYLLPFGGFVEIMSSGRTTPEVIDCIADELRDIGQTPIICRADSTGFIANRIWAALKREIMMVLADGVGSPTDIDDVFKCCFQSKLTPCKIMDQVGLQTVCDIENQYIKERDYLPTYAVDFIRKEYLERNESLLPKQAVSKVETPNQLRERLIGAWELLECVSISHDADGLQQKHHPFGTNISGRLLYTEAGYMSAQIQVRGQAPFKSGQYFTGSEKELSQAARQYYAYTGSFYVDESTDEPAVCHELTQCIFPNEITEIQRRYFKFEQRDTSELLKLTPEKPTVTEEGVETMMHLTWKRLPVNKSDMPRDGS